MSDDDVVEIIVLGEDKPDEAIDEVDLDEEVEDHEEADEEAANEEVTSPAVENVTGGVDEGTEAAIEAAKVPVKRKWTVGQKLKLLKLARAGNYAHVFRTSVAAVVTCQARHEAARIGGLPRQAQGRHHGR